MNVTASTQWGRGRLVGSRLGLTLFCLLAIGCARLPVPIQVIHEDQRLVIKIEQGAKDEGYTHPILLKAADVATVLKGMSSRERPSAWPLRLFGTTAVPERLLRDEQLQALAPYLVEGLRMANPNERVAFALYEPGLNPTYERIVTSGWIAVHDPFFHVGLTYVRSLQPQSPTGGYYPFYPEVPPAPPPYELFFEPQQFWMKDPADGTPAIQFRDYLRGVGSLDEGG
ncbi:MAG TPA: hypothetical protein VGQ08_08790 [Nitrospiraceae bacterium]|jgi:hypothetical protein|nr:hypothetical protein [Nitrospiraceae bacterium]